MSMNILNDISKVYLEQVVDEGKSLDEAGGRHGGGSMVGKPGGPPPRTQGPQNPKDSVYSNKYRENQKNRNRSRFGPPVEEALQTPKRWWDDDGDGVGYENGEVSGKFKKKKKTRVKKESFSDWRDDLSELMEVIDSKKIKEKKKVGGKIEEEEVDNTKRIKINPKLGGALGEAVEELGGTLLEMVEIEDADCIFDDLSESEVFLLSDNLIEEVVEEFFFECIREGYNIEEIENVLVESIEVSSALLTEAKVTLGHDTDIKSNRLEKVKSAVKKVGKGLARGAGYVAGAAVRGARAVGREFSKGYDRGRGGSSGGDISQASSPQSDTKETGSKRPGLLGRIGSALKSGLKRAVGAGARAVSRGARNVARRMGNVGNGDDKPTNTQRKPSTYRGAGAGTKERVSSGSYTPPTQKKTKPAQPVSDDPWKGSATAPKRRISKRERGELFSSIRNESKAELDEKMNLKKAEMGTVIKDFYKSDAPQFKGRTKEERRKMAVAAKLTAERGGLKLGEQMVDEPVAPAPDPAIDKNKQNLDKQKIANIRMLQQKQQMLQRQKLQMQKSGNLPLDAS